MKTNQTWAMTDFSAGVASNPKKPADGLLVRAESVDTFTPGSVSLSRSFAKISGTYFDAEVVFLLPITHLPDTINPYVFAFLSNGKIWRFRRDGTGFTLVYTDPDASIMSAAVFMGRLYWTTPTHLNNIALEGFYSISQATWTTAVNYDVYPQRTFANGWSSHPLLVVNEGSGTSVLYIGDKHQIARLACNTITAMYTYTSAYCTFDATRRVLDFVQTDSHTVVYLSDYNGAVWSVSERFVMDLASGMVTSRKSFEGLNITRAFSVLDTEYALGGLYGDIRLYQWSGYDVELVRRLDPTFYGIGLRRACNVRSERGTMVIAGAFDGTLHTYGRSFPENPIGYAQTYRLPDIPATGDVYATALAITGDAIIAGATYAGTSTSYGAYLRSNSLYASSGYISTAPIGQEDPFSIKTIDRLRIAHELPTGTSLSVSVALDGGAYHLVRTIPSSGGYSTVIDPNEFTQGRQFNTCSVRVDLLTSSSAVTPLLRGIALDYTSITH